MPLLLNILRDAHSAEYRKLRVKAMECAGLIGQEKYILRYCEHILNSYYI